MSSRPSPIRMRSAGCCIGRVSGPRSFQVSPPILAFAKLHVMVDVRADCRQQPARFDLKNSGARWSRPPQKSKSSAKFSRRPQKSLSKFHSDSPILGSDSRCRPTDHRKVGPHARKVWPRHRVSGMEGFFIHVPKSVPPSEERESHCPAKPVNSSSSTKNPLEKASRSPLPAKPTARCILLPPSGCRATTPRAFQFRPPSSLTAHTKSPSSNPWTGSVEINAYHLTVRQPRQVRPAASLLGYDTHFPSSLP